MTHDAPHENSTTRAPRRPWHKHWWNRFGDCSCTDPHTDGLGPQRDLILTLANAANEMTSDQAQQLKSLRDETYWADHLKTWWEASGTAHSVLNSVADSAAAPARSRNAVKKLFSRHGYGVLGTDAALALAARDQIGAVFTHAGKDFVFTQAHYDFLTAPWRQAIGAVHPEDAPVHRHRTQGADDI